MEILSKQDVQRIKAEHQKYLDEGAEITIPLHQRILATWKADSPAMYLRLRTQGVLEAMAFVCQQRMWDEQARLIAGIADGLQSRFFARGFHHVGLFKAVAGMLGMQTGLATRPASAPPSEEELRECAAVLATAGLIERRERRVP